MAQANEGKKDKPAHRVLLYAQTAEDISILQDILAGIGAEGVVCTDTWDLRWRMAQDTDALLLTEQSLANGALPILAEALQGQPDWSDLPVLFVATGGIESPLAQQAIQKLGNVLVLDRPVRIATLASALRMTSRTRDKQRQVRDLLQEREQREQRLRQLTMRLEGEVEAKTDSLTDTIDRLHDEAAGRKTAEDQLHKSSKILEAFFQHTIAPLAFMDRDFNFVRVNEAYALADNKSPEYFVGKNHFALYPNPENQAIFEQVVRIRQAYHAYAKPFRYPDDLQRVTYWNWLLTPLLDERGQVQFLVLNLEDVTERQEAFSELQERARQLQKLALELSQTEDRERKRIAGILHDDLQQQLAAAKFHLGLFGNRVKDDASLREATGRVVEMIKDAIATSRSLSHELSPAMLYHGDFGETLEWLANQVQVKHGLVVHVEVRGRVEVSSDPIKAFLFRTAQEILFNTVKHAGVTEAAMRLRRRKDQVRLTVCDRGRGFDLKTLKEAAGFGLLSIRERVELLGGHMKIRSTPGRGSTFLIAVPDAQVSPRAGLVAEQALSEVVDKAAERETGTCLRVLLADDHKVVREGLAILLNEQEDIEVVGQATNGREAVALTYELQPDVVVMDVAMPVMEGDEATRQIKRRLPQTRVIALSMHDEAGVTDRMREAGASTYLLKTAPSEELLAAVRASKADSSQ